MKQLIDFLLINPEAAGLLLVLLACTPIILATMVRDALRARPLERLKWWWRHGP